MLFFVQISQTREKKSILLKNHYSTLIDITKLSFVQQSKTQKKNTQHFIKKSRHQEILSLAVIVQIYAQPSLDTALIR